MEFTVGGKSAYNVQSIVLSITLGSTVNKAISYSGPTFLIILSKIRICVKICSAVISLISSNNIVILTSRIKEYR